MDRISAWIDEKPYRLQLILLGHTAVLSALRWLASEISAGSPAVAGNHRHLWAFLRRTADLNPKSSLRAESQTHLMLRLTSANYGVRPGSVVISCDLNDH